MFHGPDRALDVESQKAQDVGHTLQRFISYFKPYWIQYLFVLILMIVSTWSQVEAPQLMGQAVDCYFTPAASESVAGPLGNLLGSGATGGGMASGAASNCWFDQPQPSWTQPDFVAGLTRLLVTLVGIYLLGAASTGLMFYFMTWSGQHVIRTLRTEVFDKIMRLSIGYHVEHEAGDLMSRITNDADTIQQGMSFALVQVLSGAMLIVWVSISMLRLSLPYAGVALVMLPFMIIATNWFSRQARREFRTTRLEMGNVNAELQESISGVREAQAFTREDENISSFRAINAANRDANIRAVAYTSALSPTLQALGFVAMMLVTVSGGLALLRGTTFFGTVMSFGLMVTFIGLVQRFNQPVQQISVLWTNIQSAIAGGERIFGLMDVEMDVQDEQDAVEMPLIEGRVEFKGVWSEYKSGEPVLKGVSLTAEPGQTVAVVGPTGAGKTTIINLIPRFYDVTRGEVLIDGRDVRSVTSASLRRQIAVVLQDSFLFSATIMDNIRFGRPGASDDEVIAAAKLARADTFIDRLPEGYQTVLGERGGGLSQGQRQLLAIARAALAQPRILILDEATSSVDTRTERLIQSALEELLEGRTSFVVAHRLSTIRNADKVLVIDQGEIVERGTHNELMAARGFYYDLYMSQFRRQATSDDGKSSPSTALPSLA
ncbi:MAG: ABC transporter ATP-binding protein [Anaerolineales bacterium]|jgi:ATP-binding cassette subfamily B protein